MTDTAQRTAEHAPILAVVVENTELRQQLAEVQDQCVELAVDAGEMQAENSELRARLVEAARERDAWLAEAERVRRAG